MFTIRRPAARAICLDPQGRVLLLQASDPAGDRGRRWWEVPGGGVEHAETSADAARRELREEAGVVEVEIGPVVWTQRSRFSFGGYRFDRREDFHIAWCPSPPSQWQPHGLEALERLAFHQMAWWDLEDLLQCKDPLLPAQLPDHLPDLVAGRLPDVPIALQPP